MNLKSLSNASMISLSAYWLGDVAAQRALQSHSLGVAMNQQIALAHDTLAELDARRHSGHTALERKNKDIAELAHTHHRKARALHCYLSGLIAGADDPALAAWAETLIELLFPEGLAIINRSYVDAAGWALAIDCQMTPALLARMDAISMGGHSLAEVYRAWIAAGVALGQRVHERAQLQASLATTGAAGAEISAIQVRSLWIRTVRALLLTMDLMKLSESDRDALLAPLRRCVSSAVRPRPESADAPEPPDPGAEPEDSQLHGLAAGAAMTAPAPHHGPERVLIAAAGTGAPLAAHDSYG
jgi:hypothetical protein